VLNITQDEIPKRDWEFDDKKQSGWYSWSMRFPDTSVFETSKRIIDDLNNYIRPMTLHAVISTGKTHKDATHSKDVYLRTLNYFSGQEAIEFLNSALNPNHKAKYNKYLNVHIGCQAFLTYYKDDKLVSEWFPSREYYEKDIIDGHDFGLHATPLTIFLDCDYLMLTLYANIWEPLFREDKLALKNDENLTHILKTFEKIVHPTKVYHGNEDKISHNYGFKRPEEIFQ
jgi:hypothetical protein